MTSVILGCVLVTAASGGGKPRDLRNSCKPAAAVSGATRRAEHPSAMRPPRCPRARQTPPRSPSPARGTAVGGKNAGAVGAIETRACSAYELRVPTPSAAGGASFEAARGLETAWPGSDDLPEVVTGAPTFVAKDGRGEDRHATDRFDPRGTRVSFDETA